MKILYIDCFYGFSENMLLGALADMHDITGMSDGKWTLSVQKSERSSIECVEAAAFGADGCDATQKVIAQVIKELGIDYVMCSPVPIHDSSDGEVISALESGGVEMYPMQRSTFVLPDSARFLSSIISECAPKPAMDIISVGYGADFRDKDAFLCATVGEYGADSFLEKQYEYGEYV